MEGLRAFVALGTGLSYSIRGLGVGFWALGLGLRFVVRLKA